MQTPPSLTQCQQSDVANLQNKGLDKTNGFFERVFRQMFRLEDEFCIEPFGSEFRNYYRCNEVSKINLFAQRNENMTYIIYISKEIVYNLRYL